MNLEYKNGSIISLKLRNFQTYTSAFFKFHPRVNFIAGPNGSGKSTIANAIAFIFGASPKLLNKAKHLVDYIKFNAMETSIEAVIKTSDGNVTIKRAICSHKSKSSWFINNILSKQENIFRLYTNLKIDINNICNFLPQETVSEFSKSSPEHLFKLFVETHSNRSILSQIEKLKVCENGLDGINNDLTEIVKEKETIEKAINHMTKDVEKIKEKENLEKRVDLMMSKKNWIQYENEKANYLRYKSKIKTIETDMEVFSKENEEIEIKIKNESNRDEMKKLTEYESEIESMNDELKEFEQEIVNICHDREKTHVDYKMNEKKRESNRRRLAELVENENVTKEKLENFILPEKPQQLEISTDDLEKKIADQKRDLQNYMKQSAFIERELDELSRAKKIAENFELQRLEQLKSYHKDSYDAIIWLRNNKNKFKDEIIEPLFISISLNDQKFATEIEGNLPFQILTTFIVKNSNDFELFSILTKDEMKFGINIIEYRFRERKKQYDNDFIRSIGFDGYLIDFVNARQEILEYLSTVGDMSNIPVTKKNLDEQILLKKYNFKKMVINEKFVTIKRSIYNSKDFSITVKKLNRSGLFKKDDKIEMKSILSKISEFIEKRDKIKNSAEKTKESLENHVAELMKIKEVIDAQKLKNFEFQQKENHRARLQIELENFRKELVILKDNSQYEKIKADLTNKIKNFGDKIENKFLRFEDNCEKIENNFCSLLLKICKIKEEIDEINKIICDLQLQKKINENKLAESIRIKKQIEDDKEMKKRRLHKLKLGLKSYTSDELRLIDSFSNDWEGLEREIASETAKIAFINTDKNILKDYNEKEKHLKKCTSKFLDIEKKHKVSEADINNLKEDVLNFFGDKIEKINSNFQNLFKKLGYEGKIELETENLKTSKWKLNIFVKFRENEQLNKLSFFQSGGERSVSTMVFLLSLLDSTPMPFRLVDEINQGMDAHNERMVHKILIESVNCDSPQFFIITPKLVGNLYFNENVKVHILFAGKFAKINEKFEKYKNRTLNEE